MGILFAFIALFSWGFGDFLIQKSARKFGDWVALFYISAFASIALLPFTYQALAHMSVSDFWLLMLVSIVILFAALFDFEAFRVGKISVIEPINAIELPVTVILGAYVINEYLTPLQTLLIVILIAGIALVSTKSESGFKRIHAEKGLWYGIIAALLMGLSNFLFGFGARATNPLLINWFSSVFIALAAFIYLWSQRRLDEIVADFKGNKRIILGVSVIDNMAWVAFAYSTLYIPIAIATGISEAYVALAAALGLLLNREKLKTHQWAGLALSVSAVVLLSAITS